MLTEKVQFALACLAIVLIASLLAEALLPNASVVDHREPYTATRLTYAEGIASPGQSTTQPAASESETT